ncbi:DUF4143 domain-containing protein [Roseobacter sp. HKCCD8434]|uniref:DUF4143 domain-containing protein n=3 Tax=unclassified Roseobacter TaxID=196798 RepID=UPI0034604CC3
MLKISFNASRMIGDGGQPGTSPDVGRGLRILAEALRRLWTMLTHEQGGLLNAVKLAGNLRVSGQSVTLYLDLLVDLRLVRRLPPWHANLGKRLAKSPKVFIRDAGMTHALLGIESLEALLGIL